MNDILQKIEDGLKEGRKVNKLCSQWWELTLSENVVGIEVLFSHYFTGIGARNSNCHKTYSNTRNNYNFCLRIFDELLKLPTTS